MSNRRGIQLPGTIAIDIEILFCLRGCSKELGKCVRKYGKCGVWKRSYEILETVKVQVNRV